MTSLMNPPETEANTRPLPRFTEIPRWARLVLYLALGVGVAMIHQELQLAPELSVVQNVFLGRESNRSGVLVKGDLERFACCRPLRCWQTGDEDGLNRLRIFLPSGVVDRLYTG